MELNNIKRVYLVGIGGIGMSGLARYFHHLGCVVCGYDKTSTPLTDALHNEGICMLFEDKADLIPMNFQELDEGTLIIYTPAIPKDSQVLNFFKRKGFELQKRSQVLGLISKSMYTIAVAGTHGKTTTSCMIAHILKDSGKDCSAFLGGISSNYNTNVLYGNNNIVVVEADEYDRSFLTLHPDVAIITSMDADHLDIYGDHSQLEESFKLFASQLKQRGTLIYHNGLPLGNGVTYAMDNQAQAMATNVRIQDGDFYFDFNNEAVNISDIKMGIAGLHNIENAVAAIQAALLVNVPADAIHRALGSFKGVKRRFEYVVKTDHHIYIDDYAHHPEELRAAIASVKKLYPDKKLTVMFQPHLFTRTRDFADGFAEVLDLADELLMLDIYPARELPIEGVDSDMILSRMKMLNKRKCGKQEAVNMVRIEKPELLLTVGAGDIDTLVLPLKQVLQNV
ncbi:UDP-N-acetylmuramate--L-alanine ligase [Mucilaginibacter phyllosphaerae]|uniref:UDP-N-acetylmuramate--L-alanine ligase n=1 Tax=Mucilaginibacter phyllosphaerae TaxID=1812349 RepID=A0A4Y8AGH3_9SPHI|nr:UDP-N-acetylmuramate--L-alanine ligase [Mucilaginibacter phyllosphaerae]MBB3968509.1 UDP-N-acetylmuramate--alanine ligase [Mucilaginibacter phyllosphaerae]TEW67848.1 UDP-N-acetylmuramate--L-alanine ligase [Mucilaginibacter phyllosphaerae]GGH15572.1 UDP-N-acetylmuramate--L-alanine ligase [Mucilaginibacter phyllosphaerae]